VLGEFGYVKLLLGLIDARPGAGKGASVRGR
jgi:hypothetical protein